LGVYFDHFVELDREDWKKKWGIYKLICDLSIRKYTNERLGKGKGRRVFGHGIQ
jgi:hypothetical protein